MSATAIIRDFEPNDAEGISILFNKIYGAHYVYPEVYLPSLIRDRNANEVWHSAIAELDGEIVGHAALLFSPGKSTSAEIALMVASPKVAGRGIGIRVCRHLRKKAPQFGINMLTAILVSSHLQSQRMANPLGFGTTGLLFDYLPSSFSSNGRESYVLTCLPLTPCPLPYIDWPENCHHWIEPMSARYGIQSGTEYNQHLHSSMPIEVNSDGELITFTLNQISDRTLDEICSMPPQRPKLVRLLLGKNLKSACERLHTSGYCHTGIMPADGGLWYWLMQSRFRGESMQLHCPLARSIWEGATSENAKTGQEAMIQSSESRYQYHDPSPMKMNASNPWSNT